MGKTVLLNELRAQGERHGWLTVQIEGQQTVSGRDAVRQRLAREFATGLRTSTRPRRGRQSHSSAPGARATGRG